MAVAASQTDFSGTSSPDTSSTTTILTAMTVILSVMFVVLIVVFSVLLRRLYMKNQESRP